MFGVFHYAKIYHDALVATSVVVTWRRCPIRSRALREASPDFNSHRKSLLKINANHADDF